MSTLHIILTNRQGIPEEISKLPRATNWEQGQVGDILVIMLQMQFFGTVHLSILDCLYKQQKIFGYLCDNHTQGVH